MLKNLLLLALLLAAVFAKHLQHSQSEEYSHHASYENCVKICNSYACMSDCMKTMIEPQLAVSELKLCLLSFNEVEDSFFLNNFGFFIAYVNSTCHFCDHGIITS